MAQQAPLAQHSLHQRQLVQTLGHRSTPGRGRLLHVEAQFHAYTQAVHLHRDTLLHYTLCTTRKAWCAMSSNRLAQQHLVCV